MKMEKKYKKSLFIFRRDLRIEDNTGLIAACKNSKEVILCFIFDPNQIDEQNKYRSLRAIQFMIESIQDLQDQIKKRAGKLYIFYEEPNAVVKSIIKSKQIEAIFLNQDYTPFSTQRDKILEKICIENKIYFYSFHDYLINQPDLILNKQNKPYTIFTPFFKSCKQIPVDNIAKYKCNNFYSGKIQNVARENIFEQILPKKYINNIVLGGRKSCLKIIKNINSFKNYKKTKDYPEQNNTMLSAHNKFGTCSIREVYYAIKNKLGSEHDLVRALYWRDFFTYIAWHFPHVFGHPFYKKYEFLNWNYNTDLFKKWCLGETGFPIIDAGMRQLNNTGFMHNRVRMLTASFLIKDLHINWLWGEKYFAENLIDYDPAVNNGNWQWVASTGADSQPYFRIFNPWIQQKKFDPDCAYIKKWIPKLQDVEPKIIHNWFRQKIAINKYPLPILDHKKEAIFSKKLYKKVQTT